MQIMKKVINNQFFYQLNSLLLISKIKTNFGIITTTSLILACLVYIKTVVPQPTTPDTWIHMGIGKFIVENNRIPAHSDISYKNDVELSLEWLSHSWISDVFLYLAGNVSVIMGSILVLTPLLILNIYILFKILQMIDVDKKTFLIILPLPIILSTIFWKLHPLTFVPSMLLLLYFLYLKWKAGKDAYIFFIPLLFLLFSNMSGGVIFIPTVFIFLILCTEILFSLINKTFKLTFTTSGKLRFLLASFILSVMATFINPYYARLWIYILTFFGILEKKSWVSSLSGSLMITNQNFLRNIPQTTFLYAFFLFFLLFVAFVIVLIAIRKRNIIKEYYFLTPLIFFIFLPFIWIRFIPLSTFLILPIFGLFTQLFIIKKKIYVYSILFFLITSSLFILVSINTVNNSLPLKQIELIKKYNLSTNVLTTPDMTGYVLYSLFPIKAGIDAQDDVFDENELITTISTSIYDPQANTLAIERVTDANSIGTLLVNKNLGDMAYIFSQIDEWALLYFDDNGFLFSKREFLDESFLKEHEIKYLDLERNLGFKPENATESARELDRFTKKYPESYLALGQLASVYRYLRLFDKAEETLTKIPEDKWTYVTMTEMARLRAAQGYCKSSEKWFLQALSDRKEQNFSRAVLDLAVLYAGCLKDREKAQHFFTRYNSFQLSADEREKVRQLAEEYGIKISE